MLTKLSYSVTFPTTGRTLAGEFEFKPGFGLITGANEQGKSLIIEVVRWCLFGSSALRGKAEDYKTLRATLQFSARDQDQPKQKQKVIISAQDVLNAEAK